MNFEISDEQIARIVQEQVRDRVNKWFADNTNKYLIRDYVRQAVEKELSDYHYGQIVQEEARKQISTEVLDRVCSRVSNDIASAFADKYGP